MDVDAITRGQRPPGAVLPDVRAELLDDADRLVTEHDREGHSGQAAAIDVGVGAADPAQLLSHQESVWVGIGDIGLGDHKRPIGTVEDGRFSAHRFNLLSQEHPGSPPPNKRSKREALCLGVTTSPGRGSQHDRAPWMPQGQWYGLFRTRTLFVERIDRPIGSSAR